ncbi:hypothetical protein SAMN05216593_1052 [Pseudomonas asturiensis]|uniref:Uncharacterized protein n=1 Tax=Pseudomonas asturiensis TaxID=1190415 RepID=A0A1M7MYH3_9PSED|nr:hypothetical protein [Pseudomonas asturiensis]SHM96144.1 hypothetical protein SAMN05216593_1052 [Pseudomonas asturiensis]
MRVANPSSEVRSALLQLENRTQVSKEVPARRDFPAASDTRDTFKISGQALLKHRLFGMTDPDRNAPQLGKTQMGTSMNYVAFLTRDDRRFLGEVYEWARDNSMDLKYVDSLGLNLASYREHDDGRTVGRLNQGKVFDKDGHAMYYSFTEKDAATAQRILSSTALTSTRLDQGFVRFITDKDYGAMHHNDFDFMEQVIKRFSEAGLDRSFSESAFSAYEYKKDNFIMTRSKDKRVLGEADHLETGHFTKKSTKPKPITLESLRADLRQALFQAMGVKSFSSLFALLFKDKR